MRVQCQKRLTVRIYGHRARRCGNRRAPCRWSRCRIKNESARAGGIRRDVAYGRDSLCLSQCFVISEYEGSVFDDWAARRAAKLIAPKRRDRIAGRLGKEVIRVQSAIPQKLIHIAMELVGARLANGVYYAASCAAVLGRKPSSQN